MDESRLLYSYFRRMVGGICPTKKYFPDPDKLRKLHQSYEAAMNLLGTVSNLEGFYANIVDRTLMG